MFTEIVIYGQGGNLYIGTQADGFTFVDDSGVTPTPAYHVGNEICIIQAGNWFWLVDGQNHIRRIDIGSDVMDEPAETAGTFPADGSNMPRLLWLYRDRLFQARIASDPRNYFASKSGDYLNYDYGSLLQTGAFAGNNTQQAGLLGDILTAAVPYGDNSCVMGMANSVAIMRGDPKSGGAIDVISREIGIVRPNAWCRDPGGNLYFMSRDGLYKLDGLILRGAMPNLGGPTGLIQPMSRGRLDETLGNIDHSQVKVLMSWDPGELGLKIYLVPLSADLPTTVVYWEQRKDAFIKDVIAPGVGPTACVPINGAAQRTVILGCWDGFLRNLDPFALDDDGSAIVSQARYAPQQLLGPTVDAKVAQTRIVWGDNGTLGNFNAVYKLFVGEDAMVASNASESYANTITRGAYQSLDRTRTRGACQIFEISNDVLGKRWAIENIAQLVAPSGRIRT